MQVIYREDIYKFNPIFGLFLFLVIFMIVMCAVVMLSYIFEATTIATVAIIWVLAALSIVCLSKIPRETPSGKCQYEVIPLRDDWDDLIEGNYRVVEQRGVVYVLEDI